MGWIIGIPSLKLNTVGNKSKHCGNFRLVAAEGLEERLGRDPDIDAEKAAENIYRGFTTAEELIAYSNEHCSQLTDAKGRALRRDAVRMCATILKPPAAFMATLSREEQIRFLEDGIAKISEIVGKDNVRSIAIHFDEQAPHAHVFWEPMTKDGRLCAKEMHNLKFFRRLNVEMPEYLRSCGWDISDCDAYDQAMNERLDQKERAERHRKNGRSSAVYKADAERRLQEVQCQIDYVIQDVERTMRENATEIIEDVLNEPEGIYDNALYLLHECDEERFLQLDQEGRELREAHMQKQIEQAQIESSLTPLLEQISQSEKKKIPWETRQHLWAEYRMLNDVFWMLRAELNDGYKDEGKVAYREKYKAERAFINAKVFLQFSRNAITIFIGLTWVCAAWARQQHAYAKIRKLQKTRRTLAANTATFKRFSNAYRNSLKAGVMPTEECMACMEDVLRMFSEEAKQFRDNDPVQKARETKRR